MSCPGLQITWNSRWQDAVPLQAFQQPYAEGAGSTSPSMQVFYPIGGNRNNLYLLNIAQKIWLTDCFRTVVEACNILFKLPSSAILILY